ncbi:hypothetical protein SKAU_G00274320 [Synaphobranchus kaupii]|uniref:Uncharacterized protein n=1 Tax=Synaphobranchus kaupii TaxID=118154 RepID=A0A9Q1F0Y0_SYNKA|nr:hypothetical protein SKAU_G00274320 [Synaphobranchus kaupii]
MVLGAAPPGQLEDLLVDVAAVSHVHGDQKGRSGDQDKLQGPQADVRYGEELVVADAVAARLLGVAGEAGLFITPNTLGRHNQDQDAEDEEDGEPDAADACGVPIYTAYNGIKGRPVHFRFQVWKKEHLAKLARPDKHWQRHSIGYVQFSQICFLYIVTRIYENVFDYSYSSVQEQYLYPLLLWYSELKASHWLIQIHNLCNTYIFIPWLDQR